MNQEPPFDVDGTLSRVEDAELFALVWFEEIDAAADEHDVWVPVDMQNPGIHIAIPEVEYVAHEARPVNQPGLLDGEHPQRPLDAATALDSEFRAFQGNFFREFPQRREVHLEDEGIYPSSDEDSDDDQDPESGNINMHDLADSPEPAADNMNRDSESADDINMTDQFLEPAGDINTVHDMSGPAWFMDMNVDVETSTCCLDVSHELEDTKSPAQIPIEELYTMDLNRVSAPLSDQCMSLTAAPSPQPSSKLQPSSSTLTICESSLEPNLITIIRSSKSVQEEVEHRSPSETGVNEVSVRSTTKGPESLE